MCSLGVVYPEIYSGELLGIDTLTGEATLPNNLCFPSQKGSTQHDTNSEGANCFFAEETPFRKGDNLQGNKHEAG